MFLIYRFAYCKNGFWVEEWFYYLENVFKRVHEYDSWFIEKNEIIEGLYYPIKVIARSADVV